MRVRDGNTHSTLVVSACGLQMAMVHPQGILYDGLDQGGGKQTQFLGQSASPSTDVNRHFPDFNSWNKDFKTNGLAYCTIIILMSKIVKKKVWASPNCMVVCKPFFFSCLTVLAHHLWPSGPGKAKNTHNYENARNQFPFIKIWGGSNFLFGQFYTIKFI